MAVTRGIHGRTLVPSLADVVAATVAAIVIGVTLIDVATAVVVVVATAATLVAIGIDVSVDDDAAIAAVGVRVGVYFVCLKTSVSHSRPYGDDKESDPRMSMLESGIVVCVGVDSTSDSGCVGDDDDAVIVIFVVVVILLTGIAVVAATVAADAVVAAVVVVTATVAIDAVAALTSTGDDRVRGAKHEAASIFGYNVMRRHGKSVTDSSTNETPPRNTHCPLSGSYTSLNT